MIPSREKIPAGVGQSAIDPQKMGKMSVDLLHKLSQDNLAADELLRRTACPACDRHSAESTKSISGSCL
jgi:hypothetical protein